MSTKMPPVPPDQRSPKGAAGTDPKTSATEGPDPHKLKPDNTDEQGQQGNIHQNTTNQGYQQDR